MIKIHAFYESKNIQGLTLFLSEHPVDAFLMGFMDEVKKIIMIDRIRGMSNAYDQLPLDYVCRVLGQTLPSVIALFCEMIDTSMLKGTLDLIQSLFIKEKDNPT